MDKYDEAIARLRIVDAGRDSYFEKAVRLIEELLGHVSELEMQLNPPKQSPLEARLARERRELERLVARHYATLLAERQWSSFSAEGDVG